MYQRVEVWIARSGMTRRELAQSIGMSYNTLNAKLRGKSNFTLDEATRLKEILRADETIEALFERSA